MPEYPDNLKIEEALQIYFTTYHFADGGYRDKYFKIKLGPVFIPVPNTASRIRAVKFHDIHHLLTGYTALWKGETEISAWEIASGCGRFFVAWFLNLGSFGVGLFLYPSALFKAFMMGRHVKTNLYHHYNYDSALLNKTVGELRREVGIAKQQSNSVSDYAHFICWVLFVFTLLAFVLLLIYFLTLRSFL